LSVGMKSELGGKIGGELVHRSVAVNYQQWQIELASLAHDLGVPQCVARQARFQHRRGVPRAPVGARSHWMGVAEG
jgi:hypothetical protein